MEEVLAAFPGDAIDADNIGYYAGLLERRLLVARCGSCHRWHQPPQPICPRCWSTDIVHDEVTGRGTVHLAIFLHQGPGVDPAHPYPVVTIALDEEPQVRITSTIVDCVADEIRVGMPVELTWIDRNGTPFPVFRPATTEA